MDKKPRPSPYPEDLYQEPLLLRLTGRDPIHEMMTAIAHDVQEALESADPRLGRPTKQKYLVREVAEITGRSQYAVRRMIEQGKLTADYAPGGALLIPREEVAKLLPEEPNEGSPSEPATAVENPNESYLQQ